MSTRRAIVPSMPSTNSATASQRNIPFTFPLTASNSARKPQITPEAVNIWTANARARRPAGRGSGRGVLFCRGNVAVGFRASHGSGIITFHFRHARADHASSGLFHRPPSRRLPAAGELVFGASFRPEPRARRFLAVDSRARPRPSTGPDRKASERHVIPRRRDSRCAALVLGGVRYSDLRHPDLRPRLSEPPGEGPFARAVPRPHGRLRLAG